MLRGVEVRLTILKRLMGFDPIGQACVFVRRERLDENRLAIRMRYRDAARETRIALLLLPLLFFQTFGLELIPLGARLSKNEREETLSVFDEHRP